MLLSISKGSKNIAAQTPREKLPPQKKGVLLLNDRVFTNFWVGGLNPCGVGFVSVSGLGNLLQGDAFAAPAQQRCFSGQCRTKLGEPRSWEDLMRFSGECGLGLKTRRGYCKSEEIYIYICKM